MDHEQTNEQPPVTHPEVAFFEPENGGFSYCNCENTEQLTPYESDAEDHTAPSEFEKNGCLPHGGRIFSECPPLEGEDKKAEELLHCIKSRLGAQKKKRPCNPYVQRTRTCQIALYRNPQDDTPIDSMKTETVRGATWRSLLIGAGAILGGGILIYQLIKSMAKKDIQAKESE